MEQYKIINRENYNYWISGSPIGILCSQIVENNFTKQRVLQIKFKNLTKYVIKSIYLTIHCYDDSLEKLDDLKETYLLDVNYMGLCEFGDKHPFVLDDRRTYKVEIIVNKVTYNGDLVWINDNNLSLEMNFGNLIDYDSDLFEQLKIEFNQYQAQLKCIPADFDNYWQCTCGQYNELDKDYCGKCGVAKDFLFSKFNKQYLEENLKIRQKQERLMQEKINFEKKELEVKENKMKKLKKLVMIFVLLVLFIVILINFILKFLDSREYINKYCKSSKGWHTNSVDSVVNNYSCGTLALYLKDNVLTEREYYKLIDSGNEKLYKDFYNISKKELLSFIEIDEDNYGGKINISYLKYLYENSEYDVPSIVYNNVLTDLFVSNDYDNWMEVVKYLSKYDFGWDDADEYLDNGYGYMLSDDDKDYDRMREMAKSNVDYSYYYHQNSGDYTCFYADLFSKDSMSLILKNSDKNKDACGYAVSYNIGKISVSDLKNYRDAGGNLLYSGYIGNLAFNLVFHLHGVSVSDFEAKLKIILDAGVDINEVQTSDQADAGLTLLDCYVSKNFYTNNSKEYYNVLKKYGAKCLKKCYYENDFKK